MVRQDDILKHVQAQEKSLAEALLASSSSSRREASVTIPWGPSAEDTLLGVHNADASMTDEDAADLSARVRADLVQCSTTPSRLTLLHEYMYESKHINL